MQISTVISILSNALIRTLTIVLVGVMAFGAYIWRKRGVGAAVRLLGLDRIHNLAKKPMFALEKPDKRTLLVTRNQQQARRTSKMTKKTGEKSTSLETVAVERAAVDSTKDATQAKRVKMVEQDVSGIPFKKYSELDDILQLAVLQGSVAPAVLSSVRKTKKDLGKPAISKPSPVERSSEKLPGAKKAKITAVEPISQAVNESDLTESPLIPLSSISTSSLSSSISMSEITPSPGSWSTVPSKTDETITALKNKVGSLTKQVEELRLLNADSRREAEVAIAHAKEVDREAREKSRAFQNRWSIMESEISRLKTVNAELVGKAESSTIAAKELEQIQNEVTKTAAKLELAEKECEKTTAEKSHLQQTVDTQQVELERIHKTEADLKSEVAMLKSKSLKYSELEIELTNLRQVLARTESDIQTTKSFRDSLIADVEKANAATAAVEAKLAAVNATFETHQSEHNEVELLKSEVMSLGRQRDAQTAAAADAHKRAETAKNVIELLKHQLATAEAARIESSNEDIEKLKLEIAASKASIMELDAMRTTYGEAQARLNSLSAESERLKSCLSDSTHRVTELESILAEHLKAKIANHLEANESVQSGLDLDSSQNAIKELEARAAILKTHLEAAITTREQVQLENAHLRDSMQLSEHYISSILSEIAAIKAATI